MKPSEPISSSNLIESILTQKQRKGRGPAMFKDLKLGKDKEQRETILR